jgi:hypothetical protein
VLPAAVVVTVAEELLLTLQVVVAAVKVFGIIYHIRPKR